jgi:hypothetical protein
MIKLENDAMPMMEEFIKKECVHGHGHLQVQVTSRKLQHRSIVHGQQAAAKMRRQPFNRGKEAAADGIGKDRATAESNLGRAKSANK